MGTKTHVWITVIYKETVWSRNWHAAIEGTAIQQYLWSTIMKKNRLILSSQMKQKRAARMESVHVRMKMSKQNPNHTLHSDIFRDMQKQSQNERVFCL